jgi:hypothetical protein
MQKLCHRRALLSRNNKNKMASNSNAHPHIGASAQISVNANSQTNFASKSSIVHGRGCDSRKSRGHSTEQGAILCG